MKANDEIRFSFWLRVLQATGDVGQIASMVGSNDRVNDRVLGAGDTGITPPADGVWRFYEYEFINTGGATPDNAGSFVGFQAALKVQTWEVAGIKLEVLE